MANKSILEKIMGFSSDFEMIVRRIYRSKVTYFFLKSHGKRKNIISDNPFNFDEIIDTLKKLGVKSGDILIVHSAYKPLKASGLTPDEIIDALLNLVGKNGTLVMPVIRKYAYNDTEQMNFSSNLNDFVFEYDVNTTKVWTGIIPIRMMLRKEAVTSRFPLNTITAIGPDAESMIAKELVENFSSPNGSNSAWKYCMDKNAWVVSLGTDLTHSLTMIHTVEDDNKETWPVKDWYRKVTFKITDYDFEQIITVSERHPKWGMFHFGERRLCRDLLKDNIMTSIEVNSIIVEAIRSKSLFEYLSNRNIGGYPYFWLGKNLKK
jgi:aminoglycoside 3-N-acetyltransferase